MTASTDSAKASRKSRAPCRRPKRPAAPVGCCVAGVVPRWPGMRTVSTFAAIATAVALVAVAQTGLSRAASASGAPAAPPVTQYVKAEPACGVAAAGRAQCLAIRRVPVSASTSGAKALVLRPGYATGPANGYTPADLATAYGINAATATTVTVGIVDAYDDPNARADLNAFDATTASRQRPPPRSGSSRRPARRPIRSRMPVGRRRSALISMRCAACATPARSCWSRPTRATITDLAIAENEAVALGAQVITNSLRRRRARPAARRHCQRLQPSWSGHRRVDR